MVDFCFHCFVSNAVLSKPCPPCQSARACQVTDTTSSAILRESPYSIVICSTRLTTSAGWSLSLDDVYLWSFCVVSASEMGDDGHEADAKVEAQVNQDVLIMEQQRQIEDEISEAIPLVGLKEDLLSTLEKEYIADPIYITKVKDLSSKYSNIRRTRPDGNCFFRAFAYAYFERLLSCKDEYKSFYGIVSRSKDDLIELGFPQFTLEDFYDTFMEVVERIGSGEMTQEELHDLFNNQGQSNYIVVYLRLITSGKLQRDADFYLNFIDGNRTMTAFCHQEVEPMFKESDHIHIIALSAALNVGVRVRYMDRGDSAQVIAHDFPEGTAPAVHLLYRPGHYDILYEL